MDVAPGQHPRPRRRRPRAAGPRRRCWSLPGQPGCASYRDRDQVLSGRTAPRSFGFRTGRPCPTICSPPPGTSSRSGWTPWRGCRSSPRRAGDPGDHRDGADRPPRLRRGPPVPDQCSDRLDIDAFRRRLEEAGYACVSQVMEHGEYAVARFAVRPLPDGRRRAVPDRPARRRDREHRTFDPDSQRSRGRVECIDLLPAREFPTSPGGRCRGSGARGGGVSKANLHDARCIGR